MILLFRRLPICLGVRLLLIVAPTLACAQDRSAPALYPLVLLPPPPPATAEQTRDMAAVKAQLTELYLRAPVNEGDTRSAQASMQVDGSYPWLNYESESKLGLPSFNHLTMVRELAVAYRNPKSAGFNNPDVREKITRGIDHWIAKNPETNHNWFMVIGVPRELDKILVLFDKELTAEERTQLVGMVRRGYRAADDAYLFEHKPATGENLIWIARAQFEAACVEGNYGLAQKAASTIANLIVTGPGEGLQVDLSFHQHGNLLYNGGYGAYYCQDINEFAFITRQTSFAPAPDGIGLATRYLLDGEQWMIRGPQWDFNVVGRSLAFPDIAPDVILNTLALSEEIAPARMAEAAAFARRLRKEAPPGEGAPQGNRLFWRSDYMVHARPGFRAGLKMYSTRTVGAESGNGEATMDGYDGDGAFSLLKTGLEYEKIYALWNWRRVPGITCAQSDQPYPDSTWGLKMKGTTQFVGGVSDGTCGAAAFDFDHEGVRAHKSAFFFDDAIVCLGADIHTANVPYPVYTTLEQNWHDGDVTSSAGNHPVLPGAAQDLEGVKWLLHGSTGYVFPESQHVHAQIEARSASWHALYPGRPPSSMQTGEVFTAWIDHGANPQDARYAYVVLPNTSVAEIARYEAPAILSNTPGQQAVWNAREHLLEALYYEAGTVILPWGATISVDHPCALLARENQGGWTISVADPAQTQAQLNVSVAGKTSRQLSFVLPTGPEAGTSVSQSFTP